MFVNINLRKNYEASADAEAFLLFIWRGRREAISEIVRRTYLKDDITVPKILILRID
jgi:hypothetical protein